ncbi:glyoxylase I 4 [Alnus glutinosa]|uniref:glyoxylase I 4 n=1 Tax=Alnus glutinosa TaxID=3517 RepID=UPI002D76A083|nr:glyoxylase I 4 [Alnus glutinosa]
MSCCSSMASLLSTPPTAPLQHKVNRVGVIIPINIPHKSNQTSVRNGRLHGLRLVTKAKMAVEGDVLEKESVSSNDKDYGVVSVHHVGILCENLERSLEFYQNILGLDINEARPDDKLPYRGAWLWVGSEMIHLMELTNPDPLTGRPEHGGRDRHTCIAIRDVSKLKAILDKAGIPYTLSRSGRPAIFTRDPDANALEFTQVE